MYPGGALARSLWVTWLISASLYVCRYRRKCTEEPESIRHCRPKCGLTTALSKRARRYSSRVKFRLKRRHTDAFSQRAPNFFVMTRQNERSVGLSRKESTHFDETGRHGRLV